MDNNELAGLLREGAETSRWASAFCVTAQAIDDHETRANRFEAASDELEKAEPVATIVRHKYTDGNQPENGFSNADWGRIESLEPGTRLYAHPPAPQVPDAISALEHELCIMQSTISSYDSPAEALRALIDWHVAVATDPRVGGKATQPEAGE